MRDMLECVIARVASPGTEAANEPLAVFYFPRREVVITRHGPYTKVVLRKPAEPALLPARPEWA
jgi:hypothetical protein